MAIVELVRRRPRELTQKQSLQLLRGSKTDFLQAKGLLQDKQFGSCGRFTNAALGASAKWLRDRGEIAITKDGTLSLARAETALPRQRGSRAF